jgi:hypothetical protein
MRKEDFIKSETYSGEIDFWHFREFIRTEFGDFEAILEMATDEDHDPPDETMIEICEQLVLFLQRNVNLIEEIVKGAYRRVSRVDPQELKVSGIPLNLSLNELKERICARKLIVSRFVVGHTKTFETRIVITPDWDHEHALNMRVVDHQITEINGYQFHLRDGELVFE